MEASPENRPASEAPAWRRVADRFARFREPGGEAFHEALARHFAHLETHPVLPLHFEYAATANARGRAAADRLARILPLERRGRLGGRIRVLDVGCAYGGFLVAFAERGARVTGIDLDERYVRLAALNLRERGLDGDIVHGDACAPHPSFRGRFDVVIANDVIEHVPRPRAFLGFLRDWLAPHGTAYLEIPNGDWPPYVSRDGHHQLFGVTRLSFEEAAAYMQLHSPGGRYDTYQYLGEREYASLFREAGLSFELLEEDVSAVPVERILEQCAELRAEAPARLATVPEAMRALVEERVRAYLERVESAPRSTPEEIRRFRIDFGPAFWTVLARRA
ncbi:MAG TPA: methyltransferase domain-containing protein [Thermoanaerobaculia bacterium]|nr:methyltransferase domain-containing protein [Thermoanaerobaculia bacterium]